VQAQAGTGEFHWPVRVYYEDTDAGGVVYHTSYLRFMERARTEWLRALGFSQETLRRREGILFAVAAMDIGFRRPARFDEQLNVITTIKNMNAASLTFNQTITNTDGMDICHAEVSVVCLEADTFRPRRIPETIKESLNHVG
jgi:acyl-CoA thioester hydrolase